MGPRTQDPAGIPLTTLRGVGPARAKGLARLGLTSVRDLLLMVPRRLAVRGPCLSIADATRELKEEVSVRGLLGRPGFVRARGRRSILRAQLRDEAGDKLPVLFFNQPWQRERLLELSAAGEPIELYGRVVETRSGVALSSPRIGTKANPLPEPGAVEPVYGLTDGIGTELLKSLLTEALEAHADLLAEPLEAVHLVEQGLPALPQAVRTVHRPASETEFDRARRRLLLEPLLGMQARLVRSRLHGARGGARAIAVAGERDAELVARLPFAPTPGQRAVMDAIRSDLGHTRPMRRLLQGEVGAGKTLIALYAALAVASAGGQAALFVPTELLAEQHLFGLRPLLRAAGLEACLLTGSLPATERRRVLARIADGASLVIGTHALFSADVRFPRLDLVVIDEQQRFGVLHKRRMLEKGKDVHLLLMTATPIPRTLALTLYGDLETSTLRELPPGRSPIETRVADPACKAELFAGLARRLERGERVFWVCPRIDSDEESDEDEQAGDAGAYVAAARRTFRELSSGALGRHGVVLVHGRLTPEERAERIQRFQSGEAGLLVGTTVVEVGIDVPAATAMVIEGAERFGLAQLHQLRGRIGRGPRASTCFLLGAESAAERMRILVDSTDGFAIAEEDLRRRGMGDLAGLRQAGGNLEGLADPLVDVDLVLFARRLVQEDPHLAEHYAELAPAVV